MGGRAGGVSYFEISNFILKFHERFIEYKQKKNLDFSRTSIDFKKARNDETLSLLRRLANGSAALFYSLQKI